MNLHIALVSPQSRFRRFKRAIRMCNHHRIQMITANKRNRDTLPLNGNEGIPDNKRVLHSIGISQCQKRLSWIDPFCFPLDCVKSSRFLASSVVRNCSLLPVAIWIVGWTVYYSVQSNREMLCRKEERPIAFTKDADNYGNGWR